MTQQRLTRRHVGLLIGATALAPAYPAYARQPMIFSEGAVAINGYDAVAYHLEEEAVEGSSEFTSTYEGATWLFSQEAHKVAFDADPSRYAPAYGGYCAYAVARGYTASTDPYAWSIVDGRLYLNYSKSVRVLWAGQRAKNIENADANWPKVLES